MEHLIPSEWFIGASWPILVVVAIASTYGLMLGADWLVKGASSLAFHLGIPKIIIGATIVSLGTTTPECAVSVMAAWSGEPGLALGNAVGSIIADTGLIFGLGCLLVRLPANRFLLSRQGWVQFGAAVLLAVLCYSAFAVQGQSAVLERWTGGLFLSLLAVYMYVSVRWSRQQPEGESLIEAELEDVEFEPQAGGVPWTTVARLLGYVFVGVAVVVVTSHVLIESVSELARQFGVPQVVIAATVVAFGTSLPELVVGLTSIRHGHPELLVGNVIGADILNVLFVIGAAAVAAPLPLVDLNASPPEIFLWLHLPTMLLILVLFRIYIVQASRSGRFSRWMGGPLVTIYLAYVIIQYQLSL